MTNFPANTSYSAFSHISQLLIYQHSNIVKITPRKFVFLLIIKWSIISSCRFYVKKHFLKNGKTVANNFQNISLCFIFFVDNGILLNLSSLLFLHMKVYEYLTIVYFYSDVLKKLSSIKTKLVHMMRYIVVERNQHKTRYIFLIQ